METSSNKTALFSFFPAPIKNTIPVLKMTLADAYEYITGPTAVSRTRELRSKTDIKEARKFKSEKFDYCTFSGIFSKRSDQALVQHSGLLCLDFDHLKNLEEVRQWLLNDDYFETQLLFRSPSGDGLKWIINIDISQTTHADYFRAVANYLKQTYNIDVDQSGKDISRACFLPYDPDCFINPKNL
ncbi:MAG: virulence protein E [Bacteroidales bacterium]|nr:virulence protein E [Bacteroidales bacterium]